MWGDWRVVAGTVAGLPVGAILGWGIRLGLGRLRRGAVLPRGSTETAGAVILGCTVAIGWGRPTLGLTLLAGLLLVALAGVDLVHHRLPDAITLPALPAAALAVVATHLLAPGSGSPLRAAGCGAALWLVFGGLSRLSARWMGRGDVKLIPTLGGLLGYQSAGAVVVGLTVAFVLGSVVSLVGLATGRLTMRSAVPLGPYLLLGCWLVLLLPAAAG